MPQVPIQVATRPLDATVTIPGSKSLTNRAMVAAALAHGTSILDGALLAGDTERMIDTLRRFGFAATSDSDANRIEITGRGGHVPAMESDCFCGNSGTTIRFCAAVAALGHGRYRFDGVPRIRERPIGQLADALQSLGAFVEYEDREGFPPLTVIARGLSGGTVTFDRPPSSQFLSALLLAAPAAANDVLIRVNGPLPSAPYVAMTTSLMADFGPAVIEDVRPNSARFIVAAPQPYHARQYNIEPDASNASYFLAAPAIAGGRITVNSLGTSSIQGDVLFVDALEKMGCEIEREVDRLTVHGPAVGTRLRAIDLDLNAMPDMVQTVAVLAMFADGPTTIRNVANLRLKETDRLDALKRELTALGARIDLRDDGLTIRPPDRIGPANVNTYGDHRMAMSFALIGLRVEGIVIKDADCVDKTFPDFFRRWADLTR